MKKSIKFWNSLNFKLISEKKNFFAHLIFYDILQGINISLFLIHDKKIRRNYYMDSLGVNSIALLSTNIFEEYSLAKKYSKQYSKIFKIKINNKNFKLFIFRGTSNEIIEILQPTVE